MARELPVERITVKSGDFEEAVVRPRLVGTVFHVTSSKGFEGITTSGTIRHNQDGKLAASFPQSSISYGRRRGLVCLFDLRDVGDEDRFWSNFKKFSLPNPRVFLFLDPSEYAKVRPWTDANNREVNRRGEMFIPYVEGWYPGDVPVKALSCALVVTLVRDPWSDRLSSLRTAGRHGGWLDPQEDLIEAQTIAELKQKAEEWVRCARLGGLVVEAGWDEDRAEKSDVGYRIAVGGAPVQEQGADPELCPKCGTELRTHSLASSFDVRGRPFVPSELVCMGCAYCRPVLEPVETADAPLLKQLTAKEWDDAYGHLMEIWRRLFEDDEKFLAAYREEYGDDTRALTAWRKAYK